MSKVTIELEVKTPMVPNFLTVEDRKEPVSIADLSDSDLIKVAEKWKCALLKRAETIRNDRKREKEIKYRKYK